MFEDSGAFSSRFRGGFLIGLSPPYPVVSASRS